MAYVTRSVGENSKETSTISTLTIGEYVHFSPNKSNSSIHFNCRINDFLVNSNEKARRLRPRALSWLTMSEIID